MELIRLENVKKIYQSGEVITKAVDGIDFTVEKGEFALIIGASGAGKTTVLNILGGMDKCSEGEIFVAGREISALKEKELLMLGFVGFAKKTDLKLSTEVDSALWVPVDQAMEKLKGSEIAYRILEAYLADPEGIRRSAHGEKEFLPEADE